MVEGPTSWPGMQRLVRQRRWQVAIRHTERVADAGAICSVGSRRNSCDNALAESVIGLFKTELVKKQGPAEFEATYCANSTTVDAADSKPASLQETQGDSRSA